LLKPKQEKKEEPIDTDEYTMVHKRILSRKEQEKIEEPEFTNELTMMRNRILSKSQHSKGRNGGTGNHII
jgi:hypothetical protein